MGLGFDASVYPAPSVSEEILFATDFSGPSFRALACARQIARQRDVLIRSVHVVDLTGHEVSRNTSFYSLLDGAHRTLRRIRHELRQAGLREAASVITSGSSAEALRDCACRRKSSLVLMGLHGEPNLTVPIFGATTRKMLRQPPCPVLTVGLRGPEPAAEPFARVLLVTDSAPASLRAAHEAWPSRFHPPFRSHIVVVSTQAATEFPLYADDESRPEAFSTCNLEQAAPAIHLEASRLNADLIILSIAGAGYLDSIGVGSVGRAVLTRSECPVITVRTGAKMTPTRLRIS